MKTFIEQKAELRDEITRLERDNERMEYQIVANEDAIIALRLKLEQVGTKE